ncbi:unnamed protein product, partial [marine sediment metagenome]
IGIDVGYTIAATTSTGKFYGQQLEPLQQRTKWRTYRSHNQKPYRQGLNRVAKQLIHDNPSTDFQVEQLLFKGKRKRTKLFRTRLSRFAYQHLTPAEESSSEASDNTPDKVTEALDAFQSFAPAIRTPAPVVLEPVSLGPVRKPGEEKEDPKEVNVVKKRLFRALRKIFLKEGAGRV